MSALGIMNQKFGPMPRQGQKVCYVCPDEKLYPGNVVRKDDDKELFGIVCTVNTLLPTPEIYTTAETDINEGSCGTPLFDMSTGSMVGIHNLALTSQKQNMAVRLDQVFYVYDRIAPKNSVAPTPSSN
jgi:hypothetical protein